MWHFKLYATWHNSKLVLQGYEFVKLHDNGKILYEMLVHESTVYSLVTLENLLGILQEFRLYREGTAAELAAD